MTRNHCGPHYYNTYIYIKYIYVYILYIYVYIYIIYVSSARSDTTSENRVTWSPGVIIRRHCSMRQLGREDGKCQTDRAIYRRLGVICDASRDSGWTIEK